MPPRPDNRIILTDMSGLTLAAAWRTAWRHLGCKLALTRQFDDGSLNMSDIDYRG
jgi:hypothetical protein